MQADPLVSFWDAFGREQNRWERLRDVFEKLRMVLEIPALRPQSGDDLLEQVQQRLDEATRLFPQPDWLAVDQERPEGIECYCGNHLGALLDVLSLAMERLAEERARECLAEGRGASDGKG